MLLMGTLDAQAQVAVPQEATSLPAVTIVEKAQENQGKDSLRVTTTTIGKGTQTLRDIPQSITIVTEKLIDDRNLDTLKDVLHNTAGVTFQAAEGGEEDIRLRSFSLATSGDIFIDGMRDAAFYERDTFNNDRIELLRGSASMLFGRGSTGGAVNQVSKQAFAMDGNEISTTLGSYNYRRVSGDFNISTGQDAGLRLTAMVTKADSNGAGSSIDKHGLAANYRFGIGTADAFSVGVYTLRNNNGMNYGIRWIKPTAASAPSTSTINEAIAPNTYYGLASDYNHGGADYLTASHLHRFADGSELKTTVRKGQFTRDQRASAINYGAGTGMNNFSDATVITRGNNNKIQDLDAIYAQSDYSTQFTALGLKHHLMTGIDLAREAKNVFAASALVPAAKPTSTVGTPNDGAWVDEAARIVTLSSAFSADNLGLYVQDMVQWSTHWKVVGGLRFDRMRGNFDMVNTAGTLTGSYAQTISDWSKRFGVMYQPDELSSYHFSWGTSFNTSADTYSYAGNTDAARRQASNTPPEQSRNIELGAKLDSANKMYSTRFAIFQSTKYNERNTDPDSAAARLLLSGQRHTTGLEIDLMGRITSQWEVFGSYMWMPDANIDVSNATANGARQGERPGLSPVHSGTVWTTYQFTPELRLGAGVNFRSEQSPATNPGFMAPAYATLDLMAEYQWSERYTFKGNVTNALNKLYADSLYTNFYVPGAGRNVQLTLTARF